MVTRRDQIGKVRGALADLLLIDGDPLADIRILQDKQRILAVMKDGEFYRAPAPRDVRSSLPLRWQAVAARSRSMADSEVLFTNVKITDGRRSAVPGEVLVRGKRISRVARNARSFAAGGTVIDGRRHADAWRSRHTRTSRGTTRRGLPIFRRCRSRNTRDRACREAVSRPGLDFCVGAATAKPRLDVVVRNAINSGLIPGPRYLAASQEITVPGGSATNLAASALPGIQLRSQRQRAGGHATHAGCSEYGVDSIKLNLRRQPGTAREREDNVDDRRGSKGRRRRSDDARQASCGARARADSVKQAVRLGCEVIYHASYTDNEALDLLEANKHKIFVAPGLSVIFKLLQEGTPYGITPAKAREMGYEDELPRQRNR